MKKPNLINSISVLRFMFFKVFSYKNYSKGTSLISSSFGFYFYLFV